MRYKILSQEEIEKTGDALLIDAFLAAMREIDVVGISREHEEQALQQAQLIKKEMLKRMQANPWVGAFDFRADQAASEEGRDFLRRAERIAEDVASMSDAEVAADIDKHDLRHLITPERIDALLDEIHKDPQKVAWLKLVWDRDKDNPSSED